MGVKKFDRAGHVFFLSHETARFSVANITNSTDGSCCKHDSISNTTFNVVKDDEQRNLRAPWRTALLSDGDSSPPFGGELGGARHAERSEESLFDKNRNNTFDGQGLSFLRPLQRSMLSDAYKTYKCLQHHQAYFFTRYALTIKSKNRKTLDSEKVQYCSTLNSTIKPSSIQRSSVNSRWSAVFSVFSSVDLDKQLKTKRIKAKFYLRFYSFCFQLSRD